MSAQSGHIFLEQDVQNVTVKEKPWKFHHVDLFQMVVIQKANGQLECKDLSSVEV